MKLVLFKTAREYIWGAFENFSIISMIQSLTVRGKLWCNAGTKFKAN